VFGRAHGQVGGGIGPAAVAGDVSESLSEGTNIFAVPCAAAALSGALVAIFASGGITLTETDGVLVVRLHAAFVCRLT